MNGAENDGDWDGADEGAPRRSRWRLPLIGILVALAAAAAVGAWLAWQDSTGSGGSSASLPVLTAPPGPDKRRPDEPGGMTVPHQDKLVYDRLVPGAPTRPVEQLLPAPETPVDRPRPPDPVIPPPPATAATNPPPAVPPTAVPAPAVPPPGTMPPPAAAPTTGVTIGALPPPGTTPEPAAPPATAQTPPLPPAATPPQVAVAPATRPAPATGGWRVQLASVGERSKAQPEWTRIQRRAAPLLDGLSPTIVEAALERGTFWRIQAGPLTDREAAAGLCGKLRAQSLDCLVVAP